MTGRLRGVAMTVMKHDQKIEGDCNDGDDGNMTRRLRATAMMVVMET